MSHGDNEKGSEVPMPADMKTECPAEKKPRKVTILVIAGFVIWVGIVCAAIYFSTR